MSRTLLLVVALSGAAGPLSAGTFERAPLAPDHGVETLHRGLTRERIGRDLFANPWATVTMGRVDVYDVFPYVESRTFQIVADTRWNRLVFGETGRSLRAYDGAGAALGALAEPRGLAADEHDHVYVADTGNDRIVVLAAATEFGDMTLTPAYAITGLHGPYDVAYSDGGTPFQRGDDRLYVADTGRNRVAAYALEHGRARLVAEIGDLGGGPGRFAGPLAIAVGRADGASTRDVYVADAHNRRIVHLRDDGHALTWSSERAHDADVLTSLDTDHFGNVYAAAPNRGVVRKYSPALEPVAELDAGLVRPRSFDVPFLTVRDHRDGRTVRMGQGGGVTVEEWTEGSGARMWRFGVELRDLVVVPGESPAARFTLTDAATVTLEIADATSGRTLVRRDAGALGAGAGAIALTADDLAAAAGAGALELRLAATSRYADGGAARASAPFSLDGRGGVSLPATAVLVGNAPNPFRPSTRIAFVLPAAGAEGASLQVFDAQGRAVRTFAGRFAPGLNEVVWDGANDRGARVPAGVYFYRLHAGGHAATRRMVLLP